MNHKDPVAPTGQVFVPEVANDPDGDFENTMC